MRKALAVLLLGAILCFSLSGCSPFTVFDAKNLMSPPKANADQQAIHKLLQGSQQDVTFVYPKSGQNRSAIIMQDFTGDGVKDAIGFCSLENAGGVVVQFLIKTAGEWHTAASFTNTALQVDRVCFADLTGSGVSDVLIGWGSAAGTTGRTAAVNAYHYDGNSIEEYTLGIYGEMALTDLDGDGVSEVFTVDTFLPAEEEGDEPSPATARLYAWRDGSMRKLYSAGADNSIISYSSALSGQLTPTLRGVVLDGSKADGSMTTQVFYLEDGTLKNAPPGVNAEDYSNLFSRPSTAPIVCRDINGDGLIEIPVVSLLPSIPPDGDLDPTCYLVEWSMFERDSHRQLVVRSLMNTAENYWFPLPYELTGRVSASNDPERRMVTYTEAMPPQEDGSQLLGSPLFTIRVFTRSSWERRGQSGGYERLASQGDRVYGILVYTRDEKLLQSIETIKSSFRLLSE